MANKVLQIDAFTDEPFKGNPAAVLLLTEDKPTEWMQLVAAEMNLSETAFVRPIEDGYSLRWFTPVAEVDLCGHATLASAHALWEGGQVDRHDPIVFQTLSGSLSATQNEGWIELNFPSEPESECELPDALRDGVGVPIQYCGKNRLDYIVEVESELAVRNLQPVWSEFEKIKTRGIIVTSRADTSDYDFISRAFFPSLGIQEDPVTGSAHCGLAPYWAKKLGKKDFYAFQASPRGGNLKVSLQDDRVILAGQAVNVLEGTIKA